MNPFFIVGSFAAISTFFSFYAEFALNYSPCSLCLIQRSLWLSILPAAICGFFFKSFAKKIIIFLLALNLCTASYHTLVQLKIIEDKCRTNLEIKNTGDYLSQLKKKEHHGCSEKSWKIANLPAPLLNGATCLFLLYVIWRRRN